MISDHSRLEGKLLVAMPGMGDQRFEKAVIYLCAHSDDGSMGFIINKPLEQPRPIEFLEKLNIIFDDDAIKIPTDLQTQRLKSGGPVEPGRGFVLHTPEYHADSTIKVDKNISLTATLEILRMIATSVGPEQYFIALGYAGWSAGQLEDEISSNGWLVTETDPDIIFDTDYGSKYLRVMNKMGINPSLLSMDTGHA